MAHVSIVSHWHLFLDDLEHSPQAFYSTLESAIERRRIPDAQTSRVTITEGGVVAGDPGLPAIDRIFVRVQREGFTLDVCAAPFGKGFFVSWWLTKPSRKGLFYALLAATAIFAVPVVLAAFSFLTGAFGMLLGATWTMILVSAGVAIAGYQLRRGFLGLEAEVRTVPVVGSMYDYLVRPADHYRLDLAESFLSAVHLSVLEVIDGIANTKGVRGPTDIERRPVFREFYRRAS